MLPAGAHPAFLEEKKMTWCFLQSLRNRGAEPHLIYHVCFAAKSPMSMPDPPQMTSDGSKGPPAHSGLQWTWPQMQVQCCKPSSQQAGFWWWWWGDGQAHTLVSPWGCHPPPQASTVASASGKQLVSHKVSQFKASEASGLQTRLLTLQESIHFITPIACPWVETDVLSPAAHSCSGPASGAPGLQGLCLKGLWLLEESLCLKVTGVTFKQSSVI